MKRHSFILSIFLSVCALTACSESAQNGGVSEVSETASNADTSVFSSEISGVISSVISDENPSEITGENSSEITDENSVEITDENSVEITDENSTEITDENSTEITDENSTEITDENSSENTGGLITDKDIPDDYIAVFHGGSGELTHETYIYKLDNGHQNMGFSYINTESWGMTAADWKQRIKSRGEVTWTDDVFTVAKNNDAYSFVTLPNDITTYSIEEFMGMFLMN